jgi:hypothetical protein
MILDALEIPVILVILVIQSWGSNDHRVPADPGRRNSRKNRKPVWQLFRNSIDLTKKIEKIKNYFIEFVFWGMQIKGYWLFIGIFLGSSHISNLFYFADLLILFAFHCVQT